MLVSLWRIKDIFLHEVQRGLRPKFPKRVSRRRRNSRKNYSLQMESHYANISKSRKAWWLQRTLGKLLWLKQRFKVGYKGNLARMIKKKKKRPNRERSPMSSSRIWKYPEGSYCRVLRRFTKLINIHYFLQSS